MRYLSHDSSSRRAMLDAIGVESIDSLYASVPDRARLRSPLSLPSHMGELEVSSFMENLSKKNISASSVPFFIGCGAYKHHIPASVDHLIQRSEFMTSYTPYQAEIAQGTLQYLYEFQTQICLLTGMDVANASMYDGSTACAEAVLMAQRVTRRHKFLLSGGLHPQYRSVVETLVHFSGSGSVESAPLNIGGDVEDLCSLMTDETACVVVQYPDFFGRISDLSPLADAAHGCGALLIVVVTEPVSFGALRSPGSMGADIVVGEGQSLGVGLQFGGPYLGLFATREKYLRNMPGRLCGETVDSDGNRGFVLTLSAREQHIRRDKATSNICTNSGLCCLAFTVHLSLLGEGGLWRLARLNHHNACLLADCLGSVSGVEILVSSFFNEFTWRTSRPADFVLSELESRGILGGVGLSRFMTDGDPHLIISSASEINSESDRIAYRDALREILS